MKRRTLLQSMIALPVAGALSGCKRHGSKSTLRVILHGPFGVVTVRRGDEYRINAFVPHDPKLQHELRFPTPNDEGKSEGLNTSYRFELREAGLELRGREPYRDHGFDDFNLGNIGEWRPEPDNYFIYLDLPAPDVITYIPPTLEVLFTPESSAHGRPGSMPLDQILEYNISDLDDVRIRSKELGDQPPVPILDLLRDYQKHWESQEHKQFESMQGSKASSMQHTFIENNLRRYSNNNLATFFFGVGVVEKTTPEQLQAHGVTFFNESLLPAFRNHSNHDFDDLQRRIDNRKLQQIVGYGRGCQASPFVDTAPAPSPNASPSPSPSQTPYRPGVYTQWIPQPHLQTVVSAHDCMPGPVSAGP